MQNLKDRHLYKHRYAAVLAGVLAVSASASYAQQQKTQTPASADSVNNTEDQTIVLTPFEVTAESENGYAAASTLAGNRLNSELRDLGSSVSVVTSQFLKDIAATDNRTLLQYTTNTEVGSIYGNFAGTGDGPTLTENSKFTNPNTNTRVRGLTSADNTRDYFLTDIPWDSYNIDRIDLQRGPNSILFGQGSPAGIINAGTKQAGFKNSNQVQVRVGSNGSYRGTLDTNQVVLKDELALRLNTLYDDEKFEQKPAFDLDRRIAGAVRWEPKFMKKGSARTVIKANFESGDITSNQPRSIPPIDRITPWFQTGTFGGNYTFSGGNWTPTTTFNAVNQATYSPFQLQDNNTGRPGNGVEIKKSAAAYNSGTANPAYNPWIGNYGQQAESPLAFFNADGTSASTSPGLLWHDEQGSSRIQQYAIGSNGAVDGTIVGVPYQRPGSILGYAQFAQNAGLPFGNFGVYKDKSITDPSIFDFYHNLIDGPNKHEWQKFHAFNVSLAQTFFDDQAGFEVTYDHQAYQNGQTGIISDSRVAIEMDVNSVMGDGTPLGTGTYPNNNPFANGTPNPNVGRPFIADSSAFTNNSDNKERESGRIVGFLTKDFTRNSDVNWLTRLAGRQTITGLYSRDRVDEDFRQWQRYSSDVTYHDLIQLTAKGEHLSFADNSVVPNTYIFLGPSLAGRSSAAGANIPAPTGLATVPTDGKIHIFNAHWNKPTDPSAPGYVDPAAPWTDVVYPPVWPDGSVPGVISTTQTQSENPANYVGWQDIPYHVIDSEKSQANRDANTTNARLTRSQVTSRAAVWQGHFWDNAIVATWGVRKDRASSFTYSENTSSSVAAKTDDRLNLDPTVYKLPGTPDNTLNVTSHSWMLVAHLDDFPGISQFSKKSPVLVSLFYNKSTDFQPAAQRVNIYGEPLPAPAGRTTDKGILLESRDGHYSLKIGRYETSSTNASSSAIQNQYFIGASQAWAANWANRFEFNWTADTQAGAVAVNDPTNTEYNYQPATGETLAQAQAREANAIAGWRAWQKSVDPRFYKAWGINLNDPTKPVSYSQPNGFAITEDSLSKGWEIELNAMPIKNWRISLNASKTDAFRENVGGKELIDFVNAYEKALHTTGAGDLRIWWGTAGNDTTLIQWNSTVGSNIKQRTLQNGTNVPELRKWHWNLITNYDFDHGFVKGLNVGMGVRYESSIVIGYKPIPDPVDPVNSVSFDLSNPYLGPADTNYDFWVGYTRKFGRFEWNIQLNVRNAFVGNELVPITAEPDGSGATYRIRPPRTWELTNSLRF